MYFVDNDSIALMTSISKIVIEKGSKFYEYMQGIINGNEKLKEILLQLQENSSAYKIDDYMNLYNLIFSMGEGTFDLIKERGYIYQQLSEKFPDVLKKIEEVGHQSLETQNARDDIFLSELKALGENILELIPNAALANGEAANTTLEALENDISEFRAELGLGKSLKHELKNEIISSIENTEVESKAHTSEEVATEILKKCEISEESVFYNPLKQSVQRGIILERAMQIAKERAEKDNSYAGIVERLDGVISVNEQSILAKNSHYNKYHKNPGEVPRILIDLDGNNYYDRILPLGTQSIEDAKTLLKLLENGGEVSEIADNVARLDDFVIRDNNFARLLAEKDNVDFSATPKKYTSPIGSLKRFYEKNEKNIIRGRAAIDIALKLNSQNYVGAAFKVIKEIKREVDEKREMIREKEKINQAVEEVLQVNVPLETFISNVSEGTVSKSNKRDKKIDSDEFEI